MNDFLREGSVSICMYALEFKCTEIGSSPNKQIRWNVMHSQDNKVSQNKNIF